MNFMNFVLKAVNGSAVEKCGKMKSEDTGKPIPSSALSCVLVHHNFSIWLSPFESICTAPFSCSIAILHL